MTTLFLIDEQSELPPSRYALLDPDGLIAVSHAVTAKLIWRAYHQGYYPCSPVDEELTLWWAPAERMVLKPSELHISKNFKKRLKQIIREEHAPNARLQVTINHCFEDVIRACATVQRSQEFDGNWISEEIITAYTELHQQGLAHSFETWQDGKLVGGLYGVSIGQIFCGESMFSKVSQASRIAFSHAVNFLAKQGVKLIDCQQDSDYLRSLGATLIPRADYEYYLHTLSHEVGTSLWPSGRLSFNGHYLKIT
jgi:leucyl/phenylalanyl-tRNA--protein transferase